jgi:hypothetical protein
MSDCKQSWLCRLRSRRNAHDESIKEWKLVESPNGPAMRNSEQFNKFVEGEYVMQIRKIGRKLRKGKVATKGRPGRGGECVNIKGKGMRFGRTEPQTSTRRETEGQVAGTFTVTSESASDGVSVRPWPARCVVWFLSSRPGETVWSFGFAQGQAASVGANHNARKTAIAKWDRARSPRRFPVTEPAQPAIEA